MSRQWQKPDPTGIDRRTFLAGTGSAVTLALAGCSGDGGDGDGGGEEGEVFNWYAGGTGGTYYPLSNEFKGIIEDNTPHSLQVQSTGASVENVGALGNETADFALVQNDTAYFAKNGTGLEEFEGEPIPNIMGVATLYPETIHIIVRPGTGIESVADMEGKRVNTGDLGSGTQSNALQVLEAVAGLQPGEDFDEQNTSFNVAVDQMRDGDIDAMFVIGAAPTGAVEDLATTTDIEILSLTGDAREAAMDAAPWFAEQTIPPGTYAGVDYDVETISVQAMIATHSGVSADHVETITQTIFDNVDELTIQTDYINAESAQDGMSIELHEGAARVFE